MSTEKRKFLKIADKEEKVEKQKIQSVRKGKKTKKSCSIITPEKVNSSCSSIFSHLSCPEVVLSKVYYDQSKICDGAIMKSKKRKEDIFPEIAISTVVKLEMPVLEYSTIIQPTVRPTQGECLFATRELGKIHPDVLKECRERRNAIEVDGCKLDILDGVVATMLSQNTTKANSTNAFNNLKEAFPTWDSILEKPVTVLEDCIRVGGLAKVRSERIHQMCETLLKERGAPISMQYIHKMSSNDEVKKELIRFKGLGKKTISCVLMFVMGRNEFPVDTHVWRITRKLGWVKDNFKRDETYDHLNDLVPDEVKFDLHCLFVEHGRQCHRCAANGKPQFPPKDGTKLICPLVNVLEKSENLASVTCNKKVRIKVE